MSYQERIVQLTQDIPDNIAAVAFYMLKQYMDAVEAADDAFCMAMYERYLTDPNKGEGTPIEEVAAQLGVVLE